MAWKIGSPQIAFGPEGESGGAPSGGALVTSSTSDSSGGGSGSAPSGSPSTPSVPSASPSGAPSAAPAESGAGVSDFDFDSIFGDGEPAPNKDTGAVIAPVVAAPVGAPPAPTAVPAAPGVAPAAAPQAPAAAPVPGEPQGNVAPGQQRQIDLSSAGPAELVHAMRQNEAAIVDHLSAQVFALTPEDAAALEADPVGQLSKHLAKVYVRSTMNTMELMQRQLPQMIQRHQQAIQKNETNAGKFYGRWTQLNKETHGAEVNRLAALYRQMNPNNSLDQMVEDLGPLVLMHLKLPLQPPPAVPQPKGRVIQPFVPASPGAAIATSAQAENEFAYMGQQSE